MAARTITAEETEARSRTGRQGARRDARDRGLRSGRRSTGSAAPSPGPAATKQTAIAPRQHERRRERHGQPRADAGARRCSASSATRCGRRAWASSRRIPAARHRQVREAGRRDRVADSGDQPVRHAGRHRHLRDQVQGRGDLLAAPVQPEDDHRNRARDARGAAASWARPEDILQVRRAAEHPAGATS